MIYIHQTSCISPQLSFPVPDLRRLVESSENQMRVVEPGNYAIPASVLRRMGKAVRIGVGAAIPLLKWAPQAAGIVIGTANGGMEDCIRFLNQIIEYDEGMLTPGNFVQSTPNAIASQMSLLNGNNAYNITHVHRGLSFENAVIDIAMLIKDEPSLTYLLGAVDEISTYNFNIDYLGGWYKKESISNLDLYLSGSEGSIAGEGAALFLVNGISRSAIACIDAIHTFHGKKPDLVFDQLRQFLDKYHCHEKNIDLFISGENGDSRLTGYYQEAEKLLAKETGVARFKHMSGEYPTASAIAVWIACDIFQNQSIPEHMLKKAPSAPGMKQILIYNNYKGVQHSFMLVSKV
jgi:hypothetical protein